MFPHPHNLLNVRAIEHELDLAKVQRKHHQAGFAPSLPSRSRAPKASFLRRAARAVAMLVG